MRSIAQRLTLPEFLTLPNIEESPAWELIEGQAIQKPMPTSHHSILQKRLVAAIDQMDSGYEAFPELRCVLRENSVVPDVTIIRADRIPAENAPVAGAPDWMIEILSPDQSTTRLITKIQNCLNEGTQLGWLVDSTEQVIMVFWQDSRMGLFRQRDRIPSLPDIPLELTAEQVFNWLKSKPS
jgi:Uma2 family endonuclease